MARTMESFDSPGKVKQQGISLIEVLVSAVLVSMILMWISDSHMKSISVASDTSQRSQAMWLAEEMLERVKLNFVPGLYQTEINGVTNIATYCASRQDCVGNTCLQEELVEYDVQQVFCNANNLDEMQMSMECFNPNNGNTMSNCSARPTVGARITASWASKTPSGGRQSTVIEGLLFSIEQALEFDGSDDHLTISGDILSETNFTVALWVRPDRFSSGWQGFFGKQDGANTNRPPSMWIASGGGLHWDSYEANGGTVRYTGTLSNVFDIGEWTHIAWVKRGTDYLFYRNGMLRHRVSNNPARVQIKTNMRLGFNDNRFKGQLDEVQTYKAALNHGQIVDIMYGASFPDADMSLHLDFDGTNWANATTDRSPDARTITASGGLGNSDRHHAIR